MNTFETLQTGDVRVPLLPYPGEIDQVKQMGSSIIVAFRYAMSVNDDRAIDEIYNYGGEQGISTHTLNRMLNTAGVQEYGEDF